MSESPVCTCIKRNMVTRYGDVKLVQVFDPYCQIKPHAMRGSTNLEPAYGKEAKE
ncbi:hypothetical protein SEA_CASSIA_64 [Arthrobacter phage Cassia]|uniref:Uncharacterized protein n=1 Tax=Arthrobacter phage Cassia TaxID=2927275 RepID=A0AAF0GN44_9CAUD|nr:hypothetical protein SEA_CASSIA_64 [Arthrobacter phage Cassia]